MTLVVVEVVVAEVVALVVVVALVAVPVVEEVLVGYRRLQARSAQVHGKRGRIPQPD